MLDQSPAAADGIVKLRAKAEALQLLRQADLFHVFDLARGPQALAGTLGALLRR
jgi:hypothetical protein